MNCYKARHNIGDIEALWKLLKSQQILILANHTPQYAAADYCILLSAI